MKKKNNNKVKVVPFYGFVVYEIIGNKLLNGLFVNNYQPNLGEIMNEIARKTNEDDVKDISGLYTDAWIGINEDKGVCTTLKISKRNIDFTYNLKWETDNGGMMGIGMKIRENQFVAFYWKKDQPIFLKKITDNINL